MTGKLVKDPFVGTVRHGTTRALFAEVEFPNGDVKTVQLFPGAGADTWPCKGDRVAVERSGGLLYAAAVWDGARPALKPGEREIYSRSASGAKRARHLFKGDGRHYIGNTVTNLCKILLSMTEIMRTHKTTGRPAMHIVFMPDQLKIELLDIEIKKLMTEEG